MNGYDAAGGIEPHLRYLGITAADATALRSVRGVVEAHADAFVRRFYEHLLAFEGTRTFLVDEAVTRRLLVAQRIYLLSLFEAQFDEDYYRHRRAIGQTHFRIGLDFQWYVGAYVLYLDFLMPLFQEHLQGDQARVAEIQAALRKATLLDMSIVLEAYHEGDKEALSVAQAKVLHQEKLAAIGLLASGLAHEIGNPLASILAICDNQLRKPQAPALVEKLQRIRQQVSRITNIVQQLVNFARPGPVAWREVSINEAVDAALAIARFSRKGKNVEVRLALDPRLPRTCGVADQLSQVFLNLFLNALDALPEKGGALKVTSSTNAAGLIAVAIEDNGCGIPPEHLRDLFTPFFTTKGVGKGTGLGLHVSHGIVREHGGWILVRSEHGRGSVFTVELPVRTGPPMTDALESKAGDR